MKVLKYFALLLLLLCGCENCPTSNEDLAQNTIFFNTKALNSEKSKIFSISSNSNNLKFRGNGKIFSAPSAANNIAVLEEGENNFKELFLKNIKSGDKTLLLKESATIKIDKPVISPKSDFIAYQGGERQLFIFPFKEQISYLISNDFLTNSIPSFSPNGEYLAFFEKQDESERVKLKVLKAKNNIEVVLDYIFEYGLPDYSGNFVPNWSADSKSIFFSMEIHSELFTLNYVNLEEKKLSSIPVDFVGVINPAVSSDKELVAFTGIDGNIYLFDYKNENALPEILVKKRNNLEFCNNSLFSNDNSVILYSRYENSEMLEFSASLEIVDLKSKKISLLMNNIEYAFWNSYAK